MKEKFGVEGTRSFLCYDLAYVMVIAAEVRVIAGSGM